MNAALALTLLLQPVPSWNTQDLDTPEAANWQSVYLGPRAGPACVTGYGANTRAPVTCNVVEDTPNEHTELASYSLDLLGHPELGLGNPTSIMMVDLNTALYRREIHATAGAEWDVGLVNGRGAPVAFPTDNPGTALEERPLPGGAFFAGLPDYSWSMYDWINKNSICPAVPEGASLRDRCHKFKGWMGVLNSNHFGSQGAATYVQLHRLALWLAGRAADMGQTRMPPGSAERWVYQDFLKEAQWEALAYEGYAQHFLQDRWSSGHMWERWFGPSYSDITSTAAGAEVAAASGLLHGSQGITTLPDPMCSPSTGTGEILPITFRRPTDPAAASFEGVGDYRLTDLFQGHYMSLRDPGEYPMDTNAQLQMMTACINSGWADVLTALQDPDMAPTNPPGLNVSNVGSACLQLWAKNWAVHLGFSLDLVMNMARSARAVVVSSNTLFSVLVGDPWMDVMAVASLEAVTDPEGITLATGGLGDFGPAHPGNAYAVADYTEPPDFNSLPTTATSTGNDRKTVFGFFNRAHTDWWCDNPPDLEELRSSEDPVDQEACAYLADRFYAGTVTSYRGKQDEQRKVTAFQANAAQGAPEDAPLRPVCALYGHSPGMTAPDRLHQGYVATPGAHAAHGYASVAAWCQRVPVLEPAAAQGNANPCIPSPPDGDDAWDVVGYVNRGRADEDVTLAGMDLGTAGEVLVHLGSGGSFPIPTQSWGDNAVVLRDPGQQLTVDGDWLVTIHTTAPRDRVSVGRFVLRVLPGPPATPVVTNVDMGDPYLPGANAAITVTVVDPETSADLSQGDELVTMDSSVLNNGAQVVQVGGAASGMCGGTFNIMTTVNKPANDRSNCMPNTWTAAFIPTDSAIFPAPSGPAVTGPSFPQEFTVENVAPRPAPGFVPMLAHAPPGGQLTLEVSIQDDNHDATPGCVELQPQDVHVTGVVGMLSTQPALDRNVMFGNRVDDFVTGTANFTAQVTVALPHRDNDNSGGGNCGSPAAQPFQVDWEAADDRGVGLSAAAPQLPVQVDNVPPRIVQVRTTPQALHPNTPTMVVLQVTVEDDNVADDVTMVTLDASGCGGSSTLPLAVVGNATAGLWMGTAVLQASSTCALRVTARDDDCADAPPAVFTLPVMNLAPTFTGFIIGWQGRTIKECDPVDVSVGFSDANGDTLDVEARITGPGGTITVPLTLNANGHYQGTFSAPCAGTYTVVFVATESNPPGGNPNVVQSPSEQLVVVEATPAECPRCHAPPICGPISAVFTVPQTQYTVLCEHQGNIPPEYAWWTPSCGTFSVPNPDQPWDVIWSHPHPPCDPTTDHASELVYVDVTGGGWRVTCGYQGASTGEGMACSAPVAQ